MSDFNGAFRFYPGSPASTAQVLQKVTHREDDDRRERQGLQRLRFVLLVDSLKWGIPLKHEFQ